MTASKHTPTDELRSRVRALASVGTKKLEIAKMLGISFRTLTKYYDVELTTSAASATAAIAQKVLKNARDGDSEAAFFWLKENARKNQGIVELHDVEDPLELLKAVWVNNEIDIDVRMTAARAALPYIHGKVAEKGKKETKADEAKKATQGGKFGTLGSQLRS